MGLVLFGICFIIFVLFIRWFFGPFLDGVLEKQSESDRRKARERFKKIESKFQRSLQEWLQTEEPKYRNSKGYPKDWQRRRALVYSRDNGICQECGADCGSQDCTKYEIFNYESDEILVHNAHVHHKIPITNGGDHSLSNLEYLCRECHQKKHPDFSLYSVRECINRAKRMVLNKKKLTEQIAQEEYTCDVCGLAIRPGLTYYNYFRRYKYSRREINICSDCHLVYYNYSRSYRRSRRLNK